MNEYLDEHEQWEAIKTWWKKNGFQLALILVLSVGVGLGWRYWQSYTLEKKQGASQLFDQLLSVQKTDINDPRIEAIYKELQKNDSSTIYAPLAALFEAKSLVLKGNYSEAESTLQWAASHFSKPEFQSIAQIRLARVLLADKKPDQAMATLATLNESAFEPIAEQVKGDIYVAKGDTAKARESYQKALVGIPTTQPLYQYISMQLNQQ